MCISNLVMINNSQNFYTYTSFSLRREKGNFGWKFT